jgi:hypothetical protein
MSKPRSAAPIIAAVLLLVPVLYVGSHLALVVPQGRLVSRPTLPHESPYPPYNTYYRVDGDWSRGVFWPLEQIDRLMRPGAWESQFRINSTGGGLSGIQAKRPRQDAEGMIPAP